MTEPAMLTGNNACSRNPIRFLIAIAAGLVLCALAPFSKPLTGQENRWRYAPIGERPSWSGQPTNRQAWSASPPRARHPTATTSPAPQWEHGRFVPADNGHLPPQWQSLPPRRGEAMPRFPFAYPAGQDHRLVMPTFSQQNPHARAAPPAGPSRAENAQHTTRPYHNASSTIMHVPQESDSTQPSRRPNHPANNLQDERPAATEAADRPASSRNSSPASDRSGTAASTNREQLAAQPQFGESFIHHPPKMDSRGSQARYSSTDFGADPELEAWSYDPVAQMQIYQGKSLNANQRPLLELGQPYYFLGEVPESSPIFGETNLASPRFLLYGDYRTAIANNGQAGDSSSVWAHRLNLDFDLKLTATERFHAFMGPIDRGTSFTRAEFNDGQFRFVPEIDAEFDAAFFEGDLGAIMGGIGNEVLPFEMPIAIGLMPLLFQNGTWMDDAILGAAVTFPARSSPTFDISNYDITFFGGFDKIDSPAFLGDDHAARLYGVTSFVEAWEGYFELGYAYLDDRRQLNRDYHNIGASYSRRYGHLVSTSYRVIANVGQNAVGPQDTADGALLLWENSLMTSSPYTCVPYLNLFAGFGRPQSAARALNAGGILRNTGILFETDGLTGYPTLDATGNDTFGGALGLNLLSSNFDQQLVVEYAYVQTMGTDPLRAARGPQHGVGARYQIPISNAVILRFDAMYGFLNQDANRSGIRFEVRHKF